MKLLLKNISMSLTFAVLKAYNKRKSPLREATMQIHAAAPKHREMPMGSTGFIGLRFNLMQLGIPPTLHGAKTKRVGYMLFYIFLCSFSKEFFIVSFYCYGGGSYGFRPFT